jgi:hypothetical protein
LPEDDEIIDGFCSIPCAVDENCPDSPGGTAEPSCIDISGDGWCALDCSDDKTCPGGMVCVNTSNLFICF